MSLNPALTTKSIYFIKPETEQIRTWSLENRNYLQNLSPQGTFASTWCVQMDLFDDMTIRSVWTVCGVSQHSSSALNKLKVMYIMHNCVIIMKRWLHVIERYYCWALSHHPVQHLSILGCRNATRSHSSCVTSLLMSPCEDGSRPSTASLFTNTVSLSCTGYHFFH